MKKQNRNSIIERYPFTALVLSFFGLVYLSDVLSCFRSPYCFMFDYDEFVPMMMYTFMMVSCELYHNKGS